MASNPPDPLLRELSDNESPTAELKRTVVNELWGLHTPDKLEDYNAFFRYYQQECLLLDLENLPTQTHRDVLDIISHLKANRGASRKSIRKELMRMRLGGPVGDAIGVDTSTDLALRLWLMLGIGESMAFVAGHKRITWGNGLSLRNFVDQHFQEGVSPVETFRLPPSFNAYNLEHIGGLRVIWTNSLNDHLALDDENSEVALFHHASFLKNYQNSGSK